jgi:hypothetical protein
VLSTCNHQQVVKTRNTVARRGGPSEASERARPASHGLFITALIITHTRTLALRRHPERGARKAGHPRHSASQRIAPHRTTAPLAWSTPSTLSHLIPRYLYESNNSYKYSRVVHVALLAKMGKGGGSGGAAADTEGIRVAVRVRPFLPHEAGSSSCVEVNGDINQISIGRSDRSSRALLQSSQGGGAASAARPRKTFTFDHALAGNTPQNDVYDSCVSSLVASCLEGFNATTLACECSLSRFYVVCACHHIVVHFELMHASPHLQSQQP